MELRPVTDLPAHDARVAAHPHGTLQQTSLWGRYQDTFPDRTWEGVFDFVDGDRHILTASVVAQRLPAGATYLLIPRGFLVGRAEPEDFSAFTHALHARFPSAVFVRFDPALARDTDAAQLYEAGMRAARAVPSAVETTPTTTLLLDLALPEDALLAQMHHKGRYNIRVAERHGVVCRAGTDADLPTFAALLRETAVRTGISVHQERVYRAMLDALGDHAALAVAEFEGSIAAAILTTRFAGVTTYYYGASSQAQKQVMAPYLLQWYAIRTAKSAGDRWYDFLGIAPEGADASHPLSGVTDFKRKFGGIVRSEVPPMEVILRPVLHRAFRMGRRIRAILRHR